MTRWANKSAVKEEFDSNINEISTAFTKILESSQTLLHVAKKESTTLEKKKEKVMVDDAPASRAHSAASSKGRSEVQEAENEE